MAVQKAVQEALCRFSVLPVGCQLFCMDKNPCPFLTLAQKRAFKCSLLDLRRRCGARGSPRFKPHPFVSLLPPAVFRHWKTVSGCLFILPHWFIPRHHNRKQLAIRSWLIKHVVQSVALIDIPEPPSNLLYLLVFPGPLCCWTSPGCCRYSLVNLLASCSFGNLLLRWLFLHSRLQPTEGE